MQEFTPPVIDLANVYPGCADSVWHAAVTAFDTAMRTCGLAHIDNCMSPELVRNLREASHIFFTSHDKTQRVASYGDEGYTPVGVETVSASAYESDYVVRDTVESLVILSSTKTSDGPLHAVARKYMDACMRVVRILMQLMGSALGVASETLLAPFEDPNDALRLANYPPNGGLQGYGAHRDFGGFTLLSQECSAAFPSQGALHVLVDDMWHMVRPRQGALLVNAGELMHRWTNGIYTAPLHRVVLTEGRSVSRLSLVYFSAPNDNAMIEPLHACVGDEKPLFERVRAGDWLQKKLALTNG